MQLCPGIGAKLKHEWYRVTEASRGDVALFLAEACRCWGLSSHFGPGVGTLNYLSLFRIAQTVVGELEAEPLSS